jgi:imidazolonepropionase-like amidohydrolase
VVDGASAWAREDGQAGQRSFEMPPAEVAAARAQVWRDQDFVLLRYLEEGVRVRPLADKNIDGAAHHAIQVTSADGNWVVTLLIDKKTHLVAGMEYTDQGVRAEERFSDYRAVGGLKVAYRRETRSAQLSLSTRLADVKVDGAVDASIFVKPK